MNVIYQCKFLMTLLEIIQLFTMWTWNISNYILLWRICLYGNGSHEMFIHFLHCSLLLHDRMYLLCHLMSEHHTILILPNRCYDIILWDCYHTLFWSRSNVEQVMYYMTRNNLLNSVLLYIIFLIIVLYCIGLRNQFWRSSWEWILVRTRTSMV